MWTNQEKKMAGHFLGGESERFGEDVLGGWQKT